MNIFGAKSFAHGIHPPESKGDTSGQSIRQFPFAPVLVVPLSQHIGKPALAVVREGQEVTRGQCLAKPDGFLSVAMHAPATGVVQRIGDRNGRVEPLIEDKLTQHSWPKFLHPYPLSDKYFLVSCKPTPDALWGIYLVDVFDNLVLLKEEEGRTLLTSSKKLLGVQSRQVEEH